MRESKEGEKEREHSNHLSQSPEFRQSEFVELRVKVHLLDEGYVWVPKIRDFTEDPREENLGYQNFRD